MADLKDFSGLVDLYYAKVFYHCVKIVKNNYDSADITQNTFTKAFISIKNLKNADSFGAWIFKICNNEIKLFYRNRQKNISDNVDIESITDKPSPQDSKKYDGLYSAIDFLDEKYKNLIILKYFAEFSVKEIAALVGITEKLVKSRLYDARKKLENLMSESSTNIYNFNQERKKEIMSTAKLIELGSQIIPCMSAWGQKELLKCAENNEKFSSEVLSEFSKIEKAEEFTVECGGKLSYDELIKILACCDENILHRLKKDPDKKENKLMLDVGNYCGTGGYVGGISLILHVPSIKDTVRWYKKHLNWDSDFDFDPEYGHSIIHNFSSDEMPFMSRSQIHISKSWDGEKPKNVSMFVGLESMSIVKVHDKIKSTSWDKISDVHNAGFGAMSFRVEDLNGVGIVFLEWIPDKPEAFKEYSSYLKEHGINIE